jgi:hypothetical protein
MAGGNNLRKFVQNKLPGIIRGMVSKGGVSSYNTDKGNGIWMRGGKLGADSWHTGQIGKAISSGALSTRGIANASDFKMGAWRNEKPPKASTTNRNEHCPKRERRTGHKTAADASGLPFLHNVE